MLKPYLRINQVNGITLFTDTDGRTTISAVTIKAQGDELEITQKVKDKTTTAQLKETLSIKVPVALTMTGKGVLIKAVESGEEISFANFNRVIPNGNWEDFYVQQFPTGDRNFVSIVRKGDADRWLKEFEAAGFEVLSLSFGPLVVQQVLPQLNFYEGALVFDGHRIERNEQGHWLNYKYDQANTAAFPIKVENEKLDQQLLLPYASGFQLILAADLEMVQADLPVLSSRLKTAVNDRKITAISVLVLGILFILLLANSFLFTKYTTQNEELALKTTQTEHSSKDLDSLAHRIKKTEALLDSLGWEDHINQSILVDRIAQLLPSEIQWTELNVNPLDHSHENQEQKIRFLQRKISITGSTQKIALVNEWLERIKSLTWVKDAQLKHYTYNNQENTGIFNIMITY